MNTVAPVSPEHTATSLNAGLLPQGRLERIALSDLNFYDEEHYGRKLDERRLNVLRADWDAEKAGVIYVSRRRGTSFILSGHALAVIDGHHRVTVAVEKGLVDLPALVWEGLSLQQEAALYAAFGSVLRQSAMQVFRARLTAGDSQARHLNQCIEDAGFQLSYTSHRMHPERLGNVSMLEKLFRNFGTQHLFDTLQLDAVLFPNESRRTRDYVIRSLSMMLRYYPELDQFRLQSRLQDEGFATLISKGNGLSASLEVAAHHGFGEAMVRAYNKYGGHTLASWSERVPLKDYSPKAKAAISKSAKASNQKRGKKKAIASPHPIRHPSGARRKRPVWNGAIDEYSARSD